ncbi:RidA family protein [Virgibacillus sp. W0430]|uniref:RidA family protein n=1 Tax=Virgibacillus sp. W0430 TaxID=3391580 RepID=UPI003F455D70
MGKVEKRMEELGYKLPKPWKLPGEFAFVGALVHENRAYISGSMPFVNSTFGDLPYTGKLGDTVTIEQGQELARLCIINSLAALKEEIGTLDKIDRILKVNGFVACATGFTDQHIVLNGASDFLKEVFGEKGIHARTATGVTSMPLNTPIEVEMIIALQN